MGERQTNVSTAVARVASGRRTARAPRELDDRLRCVVELSGCYYWEQDVHHRFTLVHHRALAGGSFDPQAFIGRNLWDIGGAPLDGAAGWEDLKTRCAAGQPFADFVVWMFDGKSREQYLSFSGLPIVDASGAFAGHCGIAKDVTREKLHERLASTVELAPIGIAHVDANGVFIDANRQLCDMLGYSREELLALTVKQISHPDDASITDAVRSRLRSGELDQASFEKRYLRKDGTSIWVRLTIGLKRGPDGTPLYDISVVDDISARKEAEARVQYLATHDGMTGLPNRVTFEQHLAHYVERGRRYARPFAVLFLDLDRFKQVNDSLGHEAGDRLLKAMAERFLGCLRASDMVARLGGDEFVVLLPEAADRDGVSVVARNLLTATVQPVEILGQEYRVTASIGACLFPEDAGDESSIMKHADMAMYRAKEEGGNIYQFYSAEIAAGAVERIALESNLHCAMERGEFVVHYQPRVNLESGAITGAEALLRWQNPALGAVPPAQFIPVTEEMGLIVALGRWVLQTACEQSRAWQRQGLPPICVSVNLSPRQFSDPDLVSFVAALLRDTGLAPDRLELEITEGIVTRAPDRALGLLGDLKRIGVRIAIDDFGTGYALLSQLKRYPVDTLKIDRSFVRDLQHEGDDRAITEAIISMGKSLGLTVVAEGVETAEQRAFLADQSCDEMQGFFFSTPVTAEQFANLLRTHTPATRA